MFVLQDPAKAERCTGTLEKPLELLTAAPSTCTVDTLDTVKYETKCLSEAVSTNYNVVPVFYQSDASVPNLAEYKNSFLLEIALEKVWLS